MTMLPAVACPHADSCGGCPLIDLPYREQLDWKRARVVAALSRHRELGTATIDAVVAASGIERYRRRAKLVAAAPAKLGLFARAGDHQVVDIPGCRVLTPALEKAAAALRERMTLAKHSADRVLRALDTSDATAHRGWLRAVDLREARVGERSRLLITLVLDAAAKSRPEAVNRAAHEVSRAVGGGPTIATSFHSGRSPQLLGQGLRVVQGEASVPDELGHAGLVQLAAPGAFVQVHARQAEAIALLVRDRMSAALGGLADARVLELFGGAGALGLRLAAEGARVTLAESFGPAAERAAEAAKENPGAAIEVRCGDAAEVTSSLVARGERFDAVLANPPRRGIAPEVREALGRLGARSLIYVSCDPETLARDLAHLALIGWSTALVVPFDMIPLTEEIESVAILIPGPAPRPALLLDHPEIVAVERSPHDPVTARSEGTQSLLARLRAIPGLEGATVLGSGDSGFSGIALFARTPAHAPAWDAALARPDCEWSYTAMARGITRGKGSIHRPIREGGRALEARTRYRRDEVVAGHSLVTLRPDSGRARALRQHLAGVGHALLGDGRHGHEPSNRHVGERYGLDRIFLHCSRVELTDPRTGERMVIESPLPPDLAMVLDRMRAHGGHSISGE